MLEADLFSLAQWAGQTVAASAISDAWDSARNKAARLLGRGDPKREQLAWVQLEATHDRLAVREGASLRRARHQEEARWTSRFVDLLEEDSGVETDLRALVEEFELPLPVNAESRSRSASASSSAEYSRRRGESVVPRIAPPPPRRYLHGRLPDTVRPGQVFSLLVSVVRSGGATLKHFDVPEGGRQLLLLVDAPAIKVLSERRQYVLVPADGDSEPVKFDLIGDVPGPCHISVTAWDGGSYLGELAIEVTVERDAAPSLDRGVYSEARGERTDGEVTLLVRYDPRQSAYRFEFIDVDYPDEVTSQLVYDPGPKVERLVRNLSSLAEGTAGYSPAATRAYLVNEGVTLWQELVPKDLRVQFWERQQRITQLTIRTNWDVVPWELLYPKDQRKDAGFLVEQFPVTRAIYGWAQQRRLRLQPARFVVPAGSPSEAKTEAQAIAGLLGTRLRTVTELMPLVELISNGRFGLLHFACHNRFDPDDGSSIKLDSPFTPTFLATAASDHTLAKAAPVVFINACSSHRQVPSYNKLDGWAEKFLRAGAAAFIGTLWEVTDGTAAEFAQELYRRLLAGDQLGTAVMAARHAVAAEPGDPTWMAFAVYGDPQAKTE